MSRSCIRLVFSVALAVSIAAILFGPLLAHSKTLVRDPEDFRAFYCAGQAVLAGDDPYRAEPLRTCEELLIRAVGLKPIPFLALPAPLPGYALAPFALLALLPFSVASTLATLALLFALGTTALVVKRLTAFPLVGVFAALVLSDGLISILNGQLAPIAILALCMSALALARRRTGAAALFAASGMIEPHVALPACIALAAFFPRTRLHFATLIVIFGSLSIVTVGWDANVEYFTRVLPAHAQSEVASNTQFSLTSALWRVGFNPVTAIFMGDVSYVVMTVAGIWTAKRLATKNGAPELLVLTPPAFTVFGGPFVHLTQIAIAVVALLVLLRRVPERSTAFGIALILLALPWQDLAENDAAAACAAVGAVALAIVTTIWRGATIVRAMTVIAAMLGSLVERALRLAFPLTTHDNSVAIASVSGGNKLAEATWQAFIGTRQFGDDKLFVAAHLPTWIGLMIMMGGAIAAAASSADRLRARTHLKLGAGSLDRA